MIKKKFFISIFVLLLVIGCFSGCSESGNSSDINGTKEPQYEQNQETFENNTGENAMQNSIYTDKNGDVAVIPDQFRVSEKEDEQTISTGLVVIGPDGSEFVWIPTTKTPLKVRDFGTYVSWGSSFENYWDETDSNIYQEMVKSTEKYGGFYMGRFEASFGGGDNISDYVPASKRLAEPWVRFSPEDTVTACQNLYADNPVTIIKDKML